MKQRYSPPLATVDGPQSAIQSQRGKRLTAAYLKERRNYIAPFFDYCRTHEIVYVRIARRAALRVGENMNRTRLWRIKTGECRCPTWFIAGVCHEIGQPIEIVMGQEWAQRHLATLAPDLPRPDGNEMEQRRAS
ncbi:MAG TPA: hypothetical protein VE338_12695 [Ktedonobacterales bacterium]|jgi:hypothetical protein|nr:hypothetical protein [Ktedonobacterales bacterium]